MTFPDGRIKDGLFENNMFKGAIKVKEGSVVEKSLVTPQEEYKSIENASMRDVDLRGSLQGSTTSERVPREMRIKTRQG
jgi:hypothetical protein